MKWKLNYKKITKKLNFKNADFFFILNKMYNICVKSNPRNGGPHIDPVIPSGQPT